MKSRTSLRTIAQELRKNATREERHLWYDFLKTYPVQFKRQKVIGRFVVDFYCARAKLAIELDGAQHFEEQGIARDRERSAWLMGQGLYVLRFSNRDIWENFPGVCEAIHRQVQCRIAAKNSLAEGE
ncbi:MAG TPA: endonuclease domain-containing protein [Candidatus Onthomonas avicola]|nr:endonuclease domain-containing protein [Candidatus Onthomonas avicola]